MPSSVIRRHKRRKTVWAYGNKDRSHMELYSGILLRMIKSHLSDAEFFTREDVLTEVPFRKDVSTIYRYDLICFYLRWLIDRGSLIERRRTDLYLVDHRKEAEAEKPDLVKSYYKTIVDCARNGSLRGTVSVMDIVAVWKTDPTLTINNKRTAVRRAISRMVKEGILQTDANNPFEYTVSKRG